MITPEDVDAAILAAGIRCMANGRCWVDENDSRADPTRVNHNHARGLASLANRKGRTAAEVAADLRAMIDGDSGAALVALAALPDL